MLAHRVLPPKVLVKTLVTLVLAKASKDVELYIREQHPYSVNTQLTNI